MTDSSVVVSDAPSDAAALDLDLPVALYPLTYLEEGDEVTVGRVDIDSYCVLPADGAQVLRQLGSGKTPREAADWYAATYGETVNIGEFLEAMQELELIAPAGEGAPVELKPVRWQRLGQAIFSPIGLVFYVAILALGVLAMIDTPLAAPRFEHIFVSKYLVVIELVIFVGQIPLVLLHESAHALAGRRLGLNTSLAVGRRFYFIVFETRMDGLVSVPRGKRYLPMIAGLLTDVLVICSLTFAAVAMGAPYSDAPFIAQVFLALAFGTLMRAMWQFYFYLQTDLYYVFVTVLGCNDLQKTSRKILANRWWRLLGRKDRLYDESTFHAKDRAVGRWYSWLLVAGYTFSIITLAIFVIPAMWHLATMVGDIFQPGTSALRLADGIAFSVLNIGQFVAAFWLARRERRERVRTPESTLVLD
ncbi:hypothetical protein [Luteipulveratus mongoliensis]|uniref:Uncharacterized protein n=1 Tax=Luteipulveratus mongoliensis TaxID=571913 RepID=A0A0K1JNH0_9MICO|nr:hypothetical protein [Luteipulveratus mongoliensis]AKU18259.1 hypothetical protein VV02_24420 [Luteipulveratus mongoliensis]